MISIHALLAESDVLTTTTTICTAPFLSTLSLRRATTDGLFFFDGRNNFYPRSPCGERPELDTLAYNPPFISIHALLAESDFKILVESQRYNDFYPRSPCGERLCVRCFGCFGPANFYPRTPCGERQNLASATLNQ